MSFIGSALQQFWWFAVPFFAWGIFWELWGQYAGLKFGLSVSSDLLEIRLPREYMKSSATAMDQLISALYHLHKNLLKYEQYVQGEVQRGYSLEIAGDEGEVHFYINTPRERTRYVMAEVYAQFPEAEVEVVPDYSMTKVPVDALANLKHEWDLWGTEFFLVRPDSYPLRTYIDLSLDKPVLEERQRVDPLANITEAISTCGPGEYFWYQIVMKPEIGWEKECQKLIDKIAGKDEPAKPSIMEKISGGLTAMLDSLLGVNSSEEKEKKEESRLIFPVGPEYDEMKAVDAKRMKLGYRCVMRVIYVAKKDKYNKRHAQGMLGFFRPFAKYNSLKTDKRIVTSVDYFFKKQRVRLRKRDLLLRYRMRAGRSPGFILNTEELATLFHFPGQEVATPGIQRIPAKKGAAPMELPTVASV